MKVADGRQITIEYELRLPGQQDVIDSSPPGQPLTFVHGQGQVIPGLENRIDGLEEGEEITVTVPASEGYGEKNPQMVLDVGKEELPGEMEVDIGSGLQMQTQDGAVFTGTVTDVRNDSITIDFNHPLAGQDLNFWVKIEKVS